MTKKKENNSGEIKIHEWLAISIILGIIGAIVIITQLSPIPSVRVTGKTTIFSTERIEVVVKGAVALPGVYHLPSTMSTKQLITIAQPFPDADLRRYQTDTPPLRGRVLNVSKMKGKGFCKSLGRKD